MTRWLLSLVLVPTLSLTDFEIPYGVQDPMLGSAGFKNCEGGEVGHWNVVERSTPDGKRTAIYLVLTTVDVADPAFVVCVVPPEMKVVAMHEGKPI